MSGETGDEANSDAEKWRAAGHHPEETRLIQNPAQNPQSAIQSVKRKVLVLGRDTRSFLTVIRSLGRKGFEVHTAWAPADAAALRSKYVFKHHPIRNKFKDDRWKAELRQLLVAERFDLVIPCDDPAIIPLQTNRAEFEALAKIYLLDEPVYAVTSEKSAQHELAEKLGLHLPKSRRIRSTDSIDDAFAGFEMPVVLKPVASYTRENLLERNDVQKARTLEAAREALERLLKRSDVLLQENFNGVGAGVEFIASSGMILKAFQHMRLHEPLHGGGSSYRTGVSLNPELLEAASKLTAALRYTGVGMVEFKIDPATGRWIFVEINGRFWGSLPLAVASGADFPCYLVQLLLDGTREFPQSYRTGIACRNLTSDLDWLRVNLLADRADPFLLTVPIPKLIGELGTIASGNERSDTFVLDDLRPAFYDLSGWIADKWDAVIRKSTEYYQTRPASRAKAELQARSALRNAKSILFVCWGNVCRSPYAEVAARAIVPDSVQVRSAGFDLHAGRQSPQEGIEAARARGLDLSVHRSTPLTQESVDNADVIFVFDQNNRASILRQFPNSRGKVFYVNQLDSALPLYVKDPWGYSLNVFEKTYETISRALERGWGA